MFSIEKSSCFYLLVYCCCKSSHLTNQEIFQMQGLFPTAVNILKQDFLGNGPNSQVNCDYLSLSIRNGGNHCKWINDFISFPIQKWLLIFCSFFYHTNRSCTHLPKQITGFHLSPFLLVLIVHRCALDYEKDNQFILKTK